MGAAGAAAGADPSQFMIQGSYEDTLSTSNNTATKEFTVPAGVESISVVCIGGGEVGEKSTSDPDGGNGGDLRYVNDISVSEGDILLLGAAKGFTGDGDEMDSGNSGSGGPSYLKRQTGTDGNGNPIYETLCYAQGGNNSGTNVGTGQNGTTGGNGNSNKSGDGGGAGGYTSGQGGVGAPSAGISVGKGGGGVGMTGDNEDVDSIRGDYANGPGGAHGGTWQHLGLMRGCYGGGGGGRNTDNNTDYDNQSSGAPGATRIIWGENRSYPSNAQGAFKTAPAGTQLEIRITPPIVYRDPGIGKLVKHDYVQLYGLEVIDDTGTNIVANDALSLNTDYGLLDWDTNPIHSSNKDFDDISGSSGVQLNLISNGITYSNYTALVNTGNDSGTNNLFYGDTDAESTMAKYPSDVDEYSNDVDTFYIQAILMKFDSPKVIKQIIWYTGRGTTADGWMPPCKILLDGNVIANDAAHFTGTGSGTYSSRRKCVFEFT